jgi:hypothetical protein
VALAFVSAATCFAAVLQTSPTPSHSCHEMMMPSPSGPQLSGVTPEDSDCCFVQTADLGGVARASQFAPSLVVVGITVAPSSPATAVHAVAFDPSVPIGSPPPTYLLDSVFRI